MSLTQDKPVLLILNRVSNPQSPKNLIQLYGFYNQLSYKTGSNIQDLYTEKLYPFDKGNLYKETQYICLGKAFTKSNVEKKRNNKKHIGKLFQLNENKPILVITAMSFKRDKNKDIYSKEETDLIFERLSNSQIEQENIDFSLFLNLGFSEYVVIFRSDKFSTVFELLKTFRIGNQETNSGYQVKFLHSIPGLVDKSIEGIEDPNIFLGVSSSNLPLGHDNTKQNNIGSYLSFGRYDFFNLYEGFRNDEYFNEGDVKILIKDDENIEIPANTSPAIRSEKNFNSIIDNYNELLPGLAKDALLYKSTIRDLNNLIVTVSVIISHETTETSLNDELFSILSRYFEMLKISFKEKDEWKSTLSAQNKGIECINRLIDQWVTGSRLLFENIDYNIDHTTGSLSRIYIFYSKIINAFEEYINSHQMGDFQIFAFPNGEKLTESFRLFDRIEDEKKLVAIGLSPEDFHDIPKAITLIIHECMHNYYGFNESYHSFFGHFISDVMTNFLLNTIIGVKDAEFTCPNNTTIDGHRRQFFNNYDEIKKRIGKESKKKIEEKWDKYIKNFPKLSNPSVFRDSVLEFFTSLAKDTSFHEDLAKEVNSVINTFFEEQVVDCTNNINILAVVDIYSQLVENNIFSDGEVSPDLTKRISDIFDSKIFLNHEKEPTNDEYYYNFYITKLIIFFDELFSEVTADLLTISLLNLSIKNYESLLSQHIDQSITAEDDEMQTSWRIKMLKWVNITGSTGFVSVDESHESYLFFNRCEKYMKDMSERIKSGVQVIFTNNNLEYFKDLIESCREIVKTKNYEVQINEIVKVLNVNI